MKGSIKNDQDFRLNYNVLDDFSDADFDTTDESFNQVLLWLKENFAWDRNSAVLTSTPNQVVNIIRFDSVNKNQLPNRIKIFSTLTAALQWIGLSNENLSSIQLVLEELKA